MRTLLSQQPERGGGAGVTAPKEGLETFCGDRQSLARPGQRTTDEGNSKEKADE